MGHSVQEYLEKFSTEELEAILLYYLARKEEFGHVIPEIQNILDKRKAEKS